MKELVFLLAEPSARDLLERLLPRLLPDQWTLRFVVFEGKQDLEKGLARKLRAWANPTARFVVLRDQDAADCHGVKSGLLSRCHDVNRGSILVRIACRELEAWILGDLDAFAKEFSAALARKMKEKRKYALPDLLSNPVNELRKFYPEYQKREGARRMGGLLHPSRNNSTSFKVFCKGVIKLAAD